MTMQHPGLYKAPPRLVKASELATAFGVDRKTIHVWVGKGLPASKTLGGHLRHDPLDVIAWLREVHREVPKALRALAGLPEDDRPAAAA